MASMASTSSSLSSSSPCMKTNLLKRRSNPLQLTVNLELAKKVINCEDLTEETLSDAYIDNIFAQALLLKKLPQPQQ